jgi:hypothetical protein
MEKVMKISSLLGASVMALTATVAQAQSAPAVAATSVVLKGQMLVSANGSRLGLVYRVNADGSPQIILDGRVITIPLATLSSENGKLVTSLSKNAVSDLH